jgi:hypothetical protein
MSLRRFLNVAYAILVEEYQRMGIDLISALEKVSELGGQRAERAQEGHRPQPRAVAASNEASMNMLQGMLASVPNAPTKRKPRKTK